MMKKISLILVSLFLISCSAAAKKGGDGIINSSSRMPDWVNGASASYPSSAYLLGVGSADDLDSARDRARGEISKIFSADIQSASTVFESERTVSSGGKSATESATGAATDLKAISKKTLEGIEIAESWQDKSSFRWYALATLERAKIRRIYSEKLAETEEQLSLYEKQIDSATNNMDRAMAALKAKSLLKTKDSLEKDLKVIGGSGSFSGMESSSAIRTKVESAIAALGVYVEVSPANSRISTEITKTLISLGMRVSESSDGMDIRVRCQAEMMPFQDPSLKSRWKWYAGEASVNLTDVKAGKEFLSFNASAKEAFVSEAGAKANAEKSLGRKIGKGINEAIENYFENK